MHKVSVSYLTSKNIPEDLVKLSTTDVNYIHIDVMDGKYVKAKSLPFSEVSCIHEFTNKRLDVHLMVKKPKKFIEDYVLLNTEYITIHPEIEEDVTKYLLQIKDYGIKCGLALSPNIDITILDKYIDYIDIVLLMSVVPGKGGQEFLKTTYEKIKDLRKYLDTKKSKALISVDGGINDEIAKELKEANIIVSGNYVISSDDFQEKITSLR